jgi:hypothetical protein
MGRRSTFKDYVRRSGASRCQRLLGRGRHWRSRRANDRYEFQYPTPYRLVGDVEPPLGEEFLDVAIAQRESRIEPDRMLDDRWRKAVAAIGDFGHRASLPSDLLPSYPVTLTKSLAQNGMSPQRITSKLRSPALVS